MTRFVSAVAAVAALAGCSFTGSTTVTTTSEPPATQSASPPPVDEALAKYYNQYVSWKGCGGRFECAKVEVPLSYDDPQGDSLELAVIKGAASDPDKRLGSLLVNPGGPGASGVEYARSASSIVSSDVLEAYDIVGFDPRGVGDSDPVECLNDKQTDQYVDADWDPDTPAEEAATTSTFSKFGPRCERRSADLLPHIATSAAAKDMDIIRAVVGDERMNYLGMSYGTALGASYADQFPGRVGRFVLDGAVDPKLDNAGLSKGQAIGFDKALRRFTDWCVERKDCPVGPDGAAGVQQIADFLNGLETAPLKAGERPLTEGQAINGVLGGLYSPDSWPTLSDALADALEGDGFSLQTMSDWFLERLPSGRYATNATDALVAVTCVDRPDRYNPQQVAGLAADWSREAPVFGPVLAWGMLPCNDWPVPAVDKAHAVKAAGAAPIVVVGSTYDPATPYEWAVSLAGQLDSGVLVTREGDGHTAYQMGSECVDDAIDDYLVDGVVPEDGLRCT